MTLIKKIGKGALKTLGWVAVPQVMSVIAYCNRENYDNELIPFPEAGIFILSTALTVGATFGANKIYESKVDKEYCTKNITVEVKHNASLDDTVLGNISYASPILRLALMPTSEDITKIKTASLTMEIKNTNIITFDKINGFALVKNTYYTDDFKLLTNVNGEKVWIDYRQNENAEVSKKYEKLKQKIEKIRDKAIETGNTGKITLLQDSMTTIENNYELSRIKLKKTQLALDIKLTEAVDQLNKEYSSFINNPENITSSKRDYNFNK